MKDPRFAYQLLKSRLLSTLLLATVILSGLARSAFAAGSRTPATAASSVQLVSGGVDFDKINVCPGNKTNPKPCDRTRKLVYSVSAPTNFGETSVVTQGAPNFDFTLVATKCQGSLDAGTTCTVTAKFTPLAPGIRVGAVQLMDSAGNVLVTTLIHGDGQAPTPAFTPGPEIILQRAPPRQLVYYVAIAVDAAGDVFFPNADGTSILERSRSGVVSTLAGGFSAVNGLAVDGAGNVFASVFTSSYEVIEIATLTGAQTIVGSGLGEFGPAGLAISKVGNLYIADYGANSVMELVQATGAQHTLISGTNPNTGYPWVGQPWGVAVDANANVFVTDVINDAVWELPEGNGGDLTNTLDFVLGPQGVAVDAAGDVFAADPLFEDIAEVSPGAVTNNFFYGHAPNAIAVDGLGNLYLGLSDAIVELKDSQPSALNFGQVAVGTTSAPQSITIQNVGNQPLNAVPPGLSISANFVQVPGSGSPPDCTATFSLAPGASCNLSISFVPQSSGPAQGTATLTDNALNRMSATQKIKLEGTGQ